MAANQFYNDKSNGAPPVDQHASSYGQNGSYAPQNGGSYGQYNMQQSQPYAQQQQKPQQALASNEKYVPDNFEGERFAPAKPKFNDPIWLVLFWLQFAGYVAISVIALRALGGNRSSNLGGAGSGITLDRGAAYLLCIVTVLGFVLAYVYLLIVKAFTSFVIKFTLLASVALSIAYCVYAWIQHQYSTAIVLTIFAVLNILFLFAAWRRIPFSTALLKAVIRMADNRKSTYLVAFIGTFVVSMFTVYFSFTTAAIYQAFHPGAQGTGTSGTGGSSNAKVIGLMVYSLFSFYWTQQWLSNTLLATEAGIYGQLYYAGPKGAPGVAQRAAWSSFRRSITFSSGSIAFGSFIVALFDMVRAAIGVARQAAQQDGNMILACVACVADFCVGCIQGLVEWFNRYAYIYIALYGQSYLTSAKSAWRLLKDRGMMALINDSLVNNVWVIGSYIVGICGSALVFIYLQVVNPSYVATGSGLQAAFLLYAFVVAFSITWTLGHVNIASGVSTIFVGIAEAPELLNDRDPALYSEIAQRYPHILQPV